jgi:site-specific DNA-methyltransferase (adenine-specific)
MTIYTGNGWEIREGRWQDSAPDSVDVVISDPPYDERTHAGGRHNSKDGPVAVQVEFPPVDPVEVGPPLICISRRWCVLFCAVEQLGHYQEACGNEYIRGGIWIKTDPTPQISGDRPAVWGDGVAILHRSGRKRWSRGGHPCKWVCGVERKERHHQTPKPVPLMLALVSDFSDPGELVWDPYCGSGTTGVACMRLGRRFLGHEMQPHYAKIAAERLHAEERGLTLQDVKRGQTSILDVLGDES